MIHTRLHRVLLAITGVLLAVASAGIIAAETVLTSTVIVADTSGSDRDYAQAFWPMSTSGLIDSGHLTASTTNAILCETAGCEAADRLPMMPSPQRTRIKEAQLYDSNMTAFTVDTTDANDTGPNDVALLLATPAAGDAFYFAADHPYRVLWIDVGTAGARATTFWTLAWEYYNGSTWIALQDVTDATEAFSVAGLAPVSWTLPTNMSSSTVNGKTGYHVRARVTAAGSGTVTQPKADQVWYEPGIWWTLVEDLDGDSSDSRFLEIGGASSVTRHQIFIGDNGITTADAAALESNSTSWILTIDAYIDTSAPSSGQQKFIAKKTEGLTIKVTAAKEVKLTLWRAVTEDLIPNGNTKVVSVWTVQHNTGESNCNSATDPRWECVDETTTEGSTASRLLLSGSSLDTQWTAVDFDLTSTSLLSGTTIKSVAATSQYAETGVGEFQQGIGRGGPFIYGNTHTGSGTVTETIARAGGGTWSVTDLNSLQVSVSGRRSSNSAATVTVFNTRAVVTYVDMLTTLTLTNIESGEYEIVVEWDGTDNELSFSIGDSSTTQSISNYTGFNDSPNSWEFLSGGVSPYLTEISIESNGVDRLSWTSAGLDNALDIDDGAGGDNDGAWDYPDIPTNLSVTVSSFSPTRAPSVASAGLAQSSESALAVSDVDTTVAGVTTVGDNLPFSDLIESVATTGDVPEKFLWVMLGFSGAVLALVVVQWFTQNILLAVIGGGVVLTMLTTPSVGISVVWVLIFYGLVAGAVVLIGKRLSLSA